MLIFILRALYHGILFSLRLLIANLLLTLTLPLTPLYPRQIYDLNSLIAASVWSSIQAIFTTHNAHISISGDYASIPRLENALVIANHISWTDFYLLQALAIDKGMLGRCRWFAKAQLKWVPLLGWGLAAMRMPLVTRKWTRDRVEFERVFRGIRVGGWPMWLISYPESTRYTPFKHAETINFCRLAGKPQLPHVLYPRTRGFTTCVQNLRHPTSQITHIYDITLAYSYKPSEGDRSTKNSGVDGDADGDGARGEVFMKAPTVWETFAEGDLGKRWKFHVHVERFELAGLPEGEEGVKKWIEERWREKSRLLEGLRTEWTEFEGLGEVGWLC